MKNKLIKNLVIVIMAVITGIAFNTVSFAAAGDQPIPMIDDIFSKTIPIEGSDGTVSANSAITNLPVVDIPSAVTTIIKNILSVTFILTLLALLVSGVYYLISEGNEEETGKAKKIILYIVIGMAIVGASYGIVSGITHFKLLE